MPAFSWARLVVDLGAGALEEVSQQGSRGGEPCQGETGGYLAAQGLVVGEGGGVALGSWCLRVGVLATDGETAERKCRMTGASYDSPWWRGNPAQGTIDSLPWPGCSVLPDRATYGA